MLNKYVAKCSECQSDEIQASAGQTTEVTMIILRSQNKL